MSGYDFILRFDDDNHSLTAENGIPIDKLSELLLSLSKVVPLQKDDKLVLSEVKGNCYALNFTTNSETVHQSLLVVHKKISKNDYIGLNSNQRNYARKIKSILGTKLKLDAYTKDKKFKVKINNIELPKQSEFYYHISSISGLITSIGGKSLKSKSFIHISENSFDIEINSKQEKELSKYFKNKKIRLVVNKKINTENNEIKSATLESFEVLNDDNIIDIAKDIRNKFSDDIINEFKDQYFTD